MRGDVSLQQGAAHNDKVPFSPVYDAVEARQVNGIIKIQAIGRGKSERFRLTKEKAARQMANALFHNAVQEHIEKEVDKANIERQRLILERKKRDGATKLQRLFRSKHCFQHVVYLAMEHAWKNENASVVQHEFREYLERKALAIQAAADFAAAQHQIDQMLKLQCQMEKAIGQLYEEYEFRKEEERNEPEEHLDPMDSEVMAMFDNVLNAQRENAKLQSNIGKQCIEGDFASVNQEIRTRKIEYGALASENKHLKHTIELQNQALRDSEVTAFVEKANAAKAEIAAIKNEIRGSSQKDGKSKIDIEEQKLQAKFRSLQEERIKMKANLLRIEGNQQGKGKVYSTQEELDYGEFQNNRRLILHLNKKIIRLEDFSDKMIHRDEQRQALVKTELEELGEKCASWKRKIVTSNLYSEALSAELLLVRNKEVEYAANYPPQPKVPKLKLPSNPIYRFGKPKTSLRKIRLQAQKSNTARPVKTNYIRSMHSST